MKSKTKRILSMILCFALAVVLGGEVFLSAFSVTASAAEKTYSGVLADLQKDEKFSLEEYPEDLSDTSLKVIQVAEGSDGSFFVYVYNPSKDIQATSLNLSVKDDQSGIENYKLEHIDTEGTLSKYLVLGVSVSSVVLRYYYIVSIYRQYSEALDGEPPSGNIISEVPYSVGQLWTATTVDGSPVYGVDYLEQIVLENKHVGFIRYNDLKLFNSFSGTDSHYIAFSTNRPIDMLLIAEIRFYYADFYISEHSSITHVSLESNNVGLVEPEPVRQRLEREEVFSQDNILWQDDYKYNRIQTTAEFLKGESEVLTEDVMNNLADTQWVLRFFESGYHHGSYSDGTDLMPCTNTITQYTHVSGVRVLRLEYEYDGDLYNLAVVDTISEGDDEPDNEDWYKNEYKGFIGDFTEYIQQLLSIVAAVIVLAVLSFMISLSVPILKNFFKPIKALWDALFKSKK